MLNILPDSRNLPWIRCALAYLRQGLCERLSLCPSIPVSVHLCVRPSLCPSIPVSVHLCVRPSLRPSIPVSVCLYVPPSRRQSNPMAVHRRPFTLTSIHPVRPIKEGKISCFFVRGVLSKFVPQYGHIVSLPDRACSSLLLYFINCNDRSPPLHFSVNQDFYFSPVHARHPNATDGTDAFYGIVIK